MDFGGLPPEINSGRIYAGPGAAPMQSAAAAWAELAGELRSAAAAYRSVITELAAQWRGPSSMEMARAAGSYATWIDVTAAGAEHTAGQALAAANAFDAAFAATVPPPLVAANRAQLAFLIATNVLGQNTAAIAATEMLYGEMWAQDAAAMFNYAASSAAASPGPAFGAPTMATNPSETQQDKAATRAADASLQSMPSMLRSLDSVTAPAAAAADPPADPISAIGALLGPTSPLSLLSPGIGGYLIGTEPYGLASVGSSVANLNQKLQALPSAAGEAIPQGSVAADTHTVGSTARVSSEFGRAEAVGRLSVPQGWATAAPEMKLAASVGPGIGLAGSPTTIAADVPSNVYGNIALQSAAFRAAANPDGFGRSQRGGVQPWQSTTTIIVIPDDE